MGRLSQRVSRVWSTVKCPGCGTLVARDLIVEAAPPPPTGGDGKRWSFIWTAPRGDFCPECDFPLSKYFGRLKWIRALAVGVATVLLALAGEVVGQFGRFGATYFWIMRNAVRIGALVAGVGIVGVVVGGRHGRVRVVGSHKVP